MSLVPWDHLESLAQWAHLDLLERAVWESKELPAVLVPPAHLVTPQLASQETQVAPENQEQMDFPEIEAMMVQLAQWALEVPLDLQEVLDQQDIPHLANPDPMVPPDQWDQRESLALKDTLESLDFPDRRERKDMDTPDLRDHLAQLDLKVPAACQVHLELVSLEHLDTLERQESLEIQEEMVPQEQWVLLDPKATLETLVLVHLESPVRMEPPVCLDPWELRVLRVLLDSPVLLACLA